MVSVSVSVSLLLQRVCDSRMDKKKKGKTYLDWLIFCICNEIFKKYVKKKESTYRRDEKQKPFGSCLTHESSLPTQLYDLHLHLQPSELN